MSDGVFEGAIRTGPEGEISRYVPQADRFLIKTDGMSL